MRMYMLTSGCCIMQGDSTLWEVCVGGRIMIEADGGHKSCALKLNYVDTVGGGEGDEWGHNRCWCGRHKWQCVVVKLRVFLAPELRLTPNSVRRAELIVTDMWWWRLRWLWELFIFGHG